MATKRTKTIIAVSVLFIILAAVAHAGISDLVYTTGRQQVSQLTAQSNEGQKILDAYNMIQYPQAAAETFMSTELCKSAGDLCAKYNEMKGLFGQLSSATNYFDDPSGFATNMMQQQLCQQSPATCNAYTQGMGTYGQIAGTTRDFWGTAQNYAMGNVMQQLSPEIGSKISAVYMTKGYLDTLLMDEGSSFGGEAESAGSEEEAAPEGTGMAVAQEQTTLTDILPANRKRGRCIIGFNLDGTYGDIYNCKTQQQTDLSLIAGVAPGTIVANTECFISKKGEKIFIKTKDSGEGMDTPAVCAIKIGASVFKNLVPAKIKKGPEGKSINSGTFIIGREGNLEEAQFMVAKEPTEYIVGGKKYKLPKGATVLYKDGEIKFGFDYTEESFEIFGFSSGQWVSDGVVIPDGPGTVNIEPGASDSGYKYRITGNFRLHTASERLIVAKGIVYYTDHSRIRVGQDSDIAFMSRDGGARVRTESSEVALTRCGERSTDAIDFCDGTIYASGTGFSFTEIRGLMNGNVAEVAEKYGLGEGYVCAFNSATCKEDEEMQFMLPGESYYLNGGSVTSAAEEAVTTARIAGNAGALLSGMLSEQGSLVAPVGKSTAMLGIGQQAASKLSAYVKESGLLNMQADIASIGIAPAVPDVLKNAAVPSSKRTVKYIYEDTGIKAETKGGKSCVGIKNSCTLAINAPSATPRAWIQWRGAGNDMLYINNENVPASAVNVQNDTIAITAGGKPIITVNPETGIVEMQTKEWDVGSNAFRKAAVAVMKKSEVEKLKVFALNK